MKNLILRTLLAALIFQLGVAPAVHASQGPSADQVVAFLKGHEAPQRVQEAIDRDGMEVVTDTGNGTTVAELVRIKASSFAILSPDKRAAFRIKFDAPSAHRQMIRLTLIDRQMDPRLTLRVPGAVIAASSVAIASGETAAQISLKIERAIRAISVQGAQFLAKHESKVEKSFLAQLGNLFIADAHAGDLGHKIIGAAALVAGVVIVGVGLSLMGIGAATAVSDIHGFDKVVLVPLLSALGFMIASLGVQLAREGYILISGDTSKSRG